MCVAGETGPGLGASAGRSVPSPPRYPTDGPLLGNERVLADSHSYSTPASAPPAPFLTVKVATLTVGELAVTSRTRAFLSV